MSEFNGCTTAATSQRDRLGHGFLRTPRLLYEQLLKRMERLFGHSLPQARRQSRRAFGIEQHETRMLLSAVTSGPEFLVNNNTSLDQKEADVAMNDAGKFVIAWTSEYQDGSGDGIYAQRFNATGVALGGEFQVNSFTTGEQKDAIVAVDASGDFVIVWESTAQDNVDGMKGVYAQSYAENDAPTTVGDSYSVDEDGSLNVNVGDGLSDNDTDPDGDPLTAVLVGGPSNGTLSLNADGSFSYSPDADFNGSDSFTYKTNDGTNDGNVATVTITVNADNGDGPDIVDATGNSGPNTDFYFGVLGRLMRSGEENADHLSFQKENRRQAVSDKTAESIRLDVHHKTSLTGGSAAESLPIFFRRGNDGLSKEVFDTRKGHDFPKQSDGFLPEKKIDAQDELIPVDVQKTGRDRGEEALDQSDGTERKKRVDRKEFFRDDVSFNVPAEASEAVISEAEADLLNSIDDMYSFDANVGFVTAGGLVVGGVTGWKRPGNQKKNRTRR
ncbi:MAG: cadherin-like domain-containing protein [Planctomycetes bacterium]|nr:cadherin-like domain-containing protein [Planctomycetota bacterium]